MSTIPPNNNTLGTKGTIIFLVIFFTIFIFVVILSTYTQYQTMALHSKTLAYNIKNPENAISFAGPRVVTSYR